MGIVKSKTNTKSKSSEKQENPAKPVVSVVDSLLGEKETTPKEALLEQTPLAEGPADEQQLADTNNAAISDQTEELTEAQRAEMRMNNAKMQLTTLAAQHTDLQQHIETRQAEMKRLQDEHSQATTHLTALLEAGRQLEARLREAKNRELIALGTGHDEELQAHNAVVLATSALETNDQEIKDARIQDEQTRRALDMIPRLEQEIATFQREAQEIDHLYQEMRTLYTEQHDIVGSHRAAALRTRIEEREHAIQLKKQELEEAERLLLAEQMGIETELQEWQYKAELVRKTHGVTPTPQTDERYILEAWLNFVETLRDHSKANVYISPDSTHIGNLLVLQPQDIVWFANPNNWRYERVRNARDEDVSVMSNQRVDTVRRALQHYR